jgi:hypothetical protein
VKEAFAMRVSHRLAELTNETQALTESEASELLAEIAIEANGVGIVLEDKSRAELRLTVVENTLDSGVLYAFQNTELSLCGTR